MRFATIYSGVGAADAGFLSIGWKVIAQVEADPFRRSVLRRRFTPFGAPVLYTTVKAALEADKALPEPVDLVYMDLPDWRITRWWPDAFALAKRWNPRWLIVEHSPTVRFEPIVKSLALEDWAFRILHYRNEIVTPPNPGEEPDEADRRNRGWIFATTDDEIDDLGIASNFIHLGFTLGPNSFNRKSIQYYETTRGMKSDWTCGCGETPCTCNVQDRMAAMTDATSPLLTHWVGRLIDGRWKDEKERQLTRADGSNV